MKREKKVLERASYSWSEDSVRMILTPGSTARATYLYAQEIGYFSTAYPYFTERQNLDSFLIIYTLSGKGYLEYGGNTYETVKGQCLFIHCEEHHLYYTDKEEGWQFLWVHFNGNNALGYYREFIKNGFQTITCRDCEVMEKTMRDMISLYQHRDTTTEVSASHMLTGLLTELLIHTIKGIQESLIIPEYIREMARDIDKNFRNNMPLSYFEQTYHRSRYHLIKEFKKYMGMTINEYIIMARIAHSKELLKYTDIPISEAAFEAGFQNVTHYINLFKAREGNTPLGYRKAWREG